jgi:hypothetical protein
MSFLFEYYLKMFWYKINSEKLILEYSVPLPPNWLTELGIRTRFFILFFLWALRRSESVEVGKSYFID